MTQGIKQLLKQKVVISNINNIINISIRLSLIVLVFYFSVNGALGIGVGELIGLPP
jgi:hypothetical protein